MHVGRKDVLFVGVLLCVMSLVFGWASIVRPNVLFIAFLIVSVLGTCFAAYRFFCFSDDWYRAKEEKLQNWYARHPRLTACLVFFALAGVVWQFVILIRNIFR